MWDVRVSQDIDRYDTERLRAMLAEVVRKQLSPGKELLRVITWCANGGALFRPKSGTRRFAVAYTVAYNLA